jgi:predicted aspartyl protease
VAHAILLTVALAATPVGELPPPTSPGEEVHVRLEPYLGRLVTVSARLGQEPLRLLLDTGGGQTLITPRVAERLGCTPHGRSVGLRMTGERVEFRRCDAAPLEIGGRRLRGSEVAVWDVVSVLPKDVPPLDGVLALDRLAGQPFTLDLSGRTLTLESAASLDGRVAGMKRLEARVATGLSGADLTVFVHGVLGEAGWFLFDSANLDLTQLAPHMLASMGSTPPSSGLLTLDGLPSAEVPTRVREIIHDGVLAESFLSRWVWTFRLATGELWAAPAR